MPHGWRNVHLLWNFLKGKWMLSKAAVSVADVSKSEALPSFDPQLQSDPSPEKILGFAPHARYLNSIQETA